MPLKNHGKSRNPQRSKLKSSAPVGNPKHQRRTPVLGCFLSGEKPENGSGQADFRLTPFNPRAGLAAAEAQEHLPRRRAAQNPPAPKSNGSGCTGGTRHKTTGGGGGKAGLAVLEDGRQKNQRSSGGSFGQLRRWPVLCHHLADLKNGGWILASIGTPKKGPRRHSRDALRAPRSPATPDEEGAPSSMSL